MADHTSLLERAHAAYGHRADAERLRAWIASLQPHTAQLDPGVVLACGLFHREPWALAWFERAVGPRVHAALAKLGANEVEAPEHVQSARTRLLVEEGGARLRQYRGLGTFEAFVITIAVRAFTDAHRGGRAYDGEAELVALPAAADLERELARTGQRDLFATAFREALQALEPRERTLLKLNLVDGASIDALAPVLQVSRATAARWLAAAKQSLHRGTRERLALRTRLEGHELDGLFASLESGFDLSLRRFVAEAANE